MNAASRIQAIAQRLGYRIQKGPGPIGLAMAKLNPAVPQIAEPPVVIRSGELSQAIKATPRLHLGCGQIIATGYINVDNLMITRSEPNDAATGSSNPDTRYYLQCDITQQLQLAQNSLHTIYSSHFLEHLDYSQANALLEQCFQALKPGGCLRLVVPDFQLWCRNYLRHANNFFRWYRGNFLGESWDPVQTHCTTFNGLIYGHGHKSMVDLETLRSKLERAGFASVSRQQWGRSRQVHNIAELEPMDSIRRHESLIVEALKEMSK